MPDENGTLTAEERRRDMGFTKARPIYSPRKNRKCDGCGTKIGAKSCVRLVGNWHAGEPPTSLYYCLECSRSDESRVAGMMAKAVLAIDKRHMCWECYDNYCCTFHPDECWAERQCTEAPQ